MFMKKKYLYSLAKIDTLKFRFSISTEFNYCESINYDIHEEIMIFMPIWYMGMSIHMAFIKFLFFNFGFGWTLKLILPSILVQFQQKFRSDFTY